MNAISINLSIQFDSIAIPVQNHFGLRRNQMCMHKMCTVYCTAPFVDLFKLLFAVILYNKLVLLTFRHIYCKSKNFQHESSQPSFILSQNFKQSECFEYLLKLNLKLRIPCFPPIIAFVKCVRSDCKCRNIFLQL